MIRKTISMPDEMGSWIRKRIAGSFNNESEYFRDLVRQDQEDQAKIKEINRLLQEGEDSGISNRTIYDIMDDVKERMRANGELPTH